MQQHFRSCRHLQPPFVLVREISKIQTFQHISGVKPVRGVAGLRKSRGAVPSSAPFLPSLPVECIFQLPHRELAHALGQNHLATLTEHNTQDLYHFTATKMWFYWEVEFSTSWNHMNLGVNHLGQCPCTPEPSQLRRKMPPDLNFDLNALYRIEMAQWGYEFPVYKSTGS